MTTISNGNLPTANSPNLILAHPTANESITISTKTSASWMDSLTLSLYLEESHYLKTVPLAENGGMTSWILVEKDLAPDQRPVLCSCETFRKRSFLSNTEGTVKEGIIHGIASVFCASEYRGRGYAARMMKDLAEKLFTWQTENSPCFGSILYSDIGKMYYTRLGWRPAESNRHIEFKPVSTEKSHLVQSISVNDLDEFCKRDEAMTRKAMSIPALGLHMRTAIAPDVDHMLWHIAKEEFACKHLFGGVPHAKGVVVGPPGRQVWAVWTHRYYNRPDSKSTDNILYILRLVLEAGPPTGDLPTDATKAHGGKDFEELLQYVRAVVQAAQAEAAEWKLDAIQLWNPTPFVEDVLEHSGIEYKIIEREEDSIASLFWYDEDGERSVITPVWVNNEYYAWC